jgi:hypothetical protein
MKKHYCYSESSSKTDWDFFTKNGYKYNREDNNIHIEYVSFCNKKDIIEIVGNKINSKKWVRERVSNTGNDFHIKLCNENPGKIVVYIDQPFTYKNQIIEVFDIKESLKKIKEEKEKYLKQFNS